MVLSLSIPVGAQPQPAVQATNNVKLADVRIRDACILADEATKTYYLVASARKAVRAFTSNDLVNWQGPQIIFSTPSNFWGDVNIVSIWAPELHAYKGKYYLFLTFDTTDKFPEQWRDWLPRVRRGSQVLVADSPLGPFKPFQNHSTLPVDMMTLDGTFWVEDGAPYMVFCHEWVQITNGSIDYIRLKNDLSETVGEPVTLFHGSEAPWSVTLKRYGSNITDAPYLYRTRTGKLLMIWSSSGKGGYTTGIAVSESGKLAGPWIQQPDPLYANDGGHGMIFKRFDGTLMLVLHAPNRATERAHLFELEDTGDTIRITNER
jgi:beta-xylosidase